MMLDPYSQVTASSQFPNYGFFPDDRDESFELSDYLVIGERWEEDPKSNVDGCSRNPVSPIEKVETSRQMKGDTPTSSNMNCGSGLKKIKRDIGIKVSFRTKSTVEILDDGYKWRKYGRKSVKNSPNPRNYYRCSKERCSVKKRVERDREDSSYVITTYEGVHNHETPFVACYTPQCTKGLGSSSNHMPSMVQSAWTLQDTHSAT